MRMFRCAMPAIAAVALLAPAWTSAQLTLASTATAGSALPTPPGKLLFDARLAAPAVYRYRGYQLPWPASATAAR